MLPLSVILRDCFVQSYWCHNDTVHHGDTTFRHIPQVSGNAKCVVMRVNITIVLHSVVTLFNKEAKIFQVGRNGISCHTGFQANKTIAMFVTWSSWQIL